ncbi:MAG: hypothetical protein RLY35_480 [Bacteroidota bacterium]|jgi:uncharacterized membrane protein
MGKKNKSENTFFKSVEWITSSMTWLQIFISPFALGLIIGIVIYLSNPTLIGQIIGGATIVIGLLLGIRWANRKRKTEGTVQYMSKIIATPELDKENTSNSHVND